MKHSRLKITAIFLSIVTIAIVFWERDSALAQLNDRTQNPNAANFGIAKSLTEQIGAGTGNWTTPDSSAFIIARDPFRAIRRGRQLFQRKFLRTQGQGPLAADGVGDINNNLALGAGLSDSCAGCHGRPRLSAGAGGNVATRPDSRDAPHLFGLGLKEMLADEITADLRRIRQGAIDRARQTGHSVTAPLGSKGIRYGKTTAEPSGRVDTSQVEGVDSDLRVRPFFAEGGTISIREFVVGALHKEMGLECNDPDLAQASAGERLTTPSGMVLDGSEDKIDPPPPPDAITGQYEIDPALVDHLEFYLLNYFKPGLGQQNSTTERGRRLFNSLGCVSCHVPNLRISHDRRVADVTTLYDPAQGIFNKLFATAGTLVSEIDDGKGLPPLKQPLGGPFLVEN